MTRPTRLATVVLIAAASAALAQPKGEPNPNAALVSPQVHPDKKVTFRLFAPKATEVRVRGDWLAGPPVKLEKDDKGVWAATVGPLTPDLYSYGFSVDGVRTIDPKNPTVKPGISSLDNLVFVPGAGGRLRGRQGRSRTARSGRCGTSPRRSAPSGGCTSTPRRATRAASDKYPVLYLLHGAGDEDSGWSTVGRAGFILDNLIAAKKAVPMLVVMPNGSLPPPANLPKLEPGTTPSPEARKAMEAAQGRFTDELLKDVVPLVEKTFRVQGGAGAPGDRGAVDGRRADASGRWPAPGPVRPRRGVERRPPAATRPTWRSATRRSSRTPTA